MPFVSILPRIKLVFGLLVIQLVWHILEQLFRLALKRLGKYPPLFLSSSTSANNKYLLDEVFVISRIIKVSLGLSSSAITLTRPWLFWISQKPNLIIVLSNNERKKNGGHVFASYLTGSNTNAVNLTLPLILSVLDTIIALSAVMTSRALISKIYYTLSANQKRVREFNV